MEELTKIAEDVSRKQAQAIDNWLKSLIGRFLPPDINLDCLFAKSSETKKWTDMAEVYSILTEKGLAIEHHQTTEPLTSLYKLVQNGKIISEFKYTIVLTQPL